MGEPIRVYCIDREPVPKDIPENEALLAERGCDPHCQPAKIIRIGEFHMAPCGDIKQRIHEVAGIPVCRMHLFCRAPESDGGRPVQDVYGWKCTWCALVLLLFSCRERLTFAQLKIRYQIYLHKSFFCSVKAPSSRFHSDDDQAVATRHAAH